MTCPKKLNPGSLCGNFIAARLVMPPRTPVLSDGRHQKTCMWPRQRPRKHFRCFRPDGFTVPPLTRWLRRQKRTRTGSPGDKPRRCEFIRSEFCSEFRGSPVRPLISRGNAVCTGSTQLPDQNKRGLRHRQRIASVSDCPAVSCRSITDFEFIVLCFLF